MVLHPLCQSRPGWGRTVQTVLFSPPGWYQREGVGSPDLQPSLGSLCARCRHECSVIGGPRGKPGLLPPSRVTEISLLPAPHPGSVRGAEGENQTFPTSQP